jgi:hypothetical protein
MAMHARPDPPQQVIKTYPARNQRVGDPFEVEVQTAEMTYRAEMNVEVVESEVPGCVVYDTFHAKGVIRTVARWTDYKLLTPQYLQSLCSRIVAQTGPFRYNPVTLLLEAGGFNAIRAQKLVSGLSGASVFDDNARATYVKNMKHTQDTDGSWGGNPVTTAFSLVRLHELDVPREDTIVAQGIRWLLHYPEPTSNLPGLWMSGSLPNQITNRANYIKAHDKSYWNAVKSTFQDEVEMQLTSCDMVFFDLSAIILEALLRYGHFDHPRVKRAICTLFALSKREQEKIRGCDYFSLKDEGEVNKTPDFDEFVIPDKGYKNSRKWVSRTLPWFTTPREALRIYPGRRVSATRYINSYAGEGQTLSTMVKADSVGGLCFLHLHRALSFHPQYPDSKLAILGAFHHTALQNTAGQFFGGGANVLSHLSFLKHPVAAATVLRSIPNLVRDQRRDGLFDPWIACINRRSHAPGRNPQHHRYNSETTTWYVLKALHRFGFLKHLLPV